MVNAMGYKAVQAQALTAPPYFFAIFVILGVAWYSDKYQSRTKALLISYTIGMIGTIIIWPALHYSGTTGACYFALFLIVGGFNAQGPAVGALAVNFRNPAKRAIAMGICGTIGQVVGGIGGAVRFLSSSCTSVVADRCIEHIYCHGSSVLPNGFRNYHRFGDLRWCSANPYVLVGAIPGKQAPRRHGPRPDQGTVYRGGAHALGGTQPAVQVLSVEVVVSRSCSRVEQYREMILSGNLARVASCLPTRMGHQPCPRLLARHRKP